MYLLISFPPLFCSNSSPSSCSWTFLHPAISFNNGLPISSWILWWVRGLNFGVDFGVWILVWILVGFFAGFFLRRIFGFFWHWRWISAPDFFGSDFLAPDFVFNNNCYLFAKKSNFSALDFRILKIHRRGGFRISGFSKSTAAADFRIFAQKNPPSKSNFLMSFVFLGGFSQNPPKIHPKIHDEIRSPLLKLIAGCKKVQ